MAKSTKSKEHTIHHYDRTITLLISQGQHDNGLEIKIDDGHGTEAKIYLPQSEAEELAELLQKHYPEMT